jgi:broad specificity phosphatase PhoE
MLVLVRHHPTAWTEAGLLQGRRDEPLLQPAGHHPAVQARLAPLQGREAWCSTRRRTRETAALYGWTQPVVSPLLDELDFGSFEGHTRAELMLATEGGWASDPFATVLRPALEEMEGRIDRFVAEVREGRGPALVFGHGGWIRLLAAKTVEGDRRRMNQFEFAPGAVLELAL